MNIPTYISGPLFAKAYKVVRGEVYEVLSAYDLSPTHWAILGATLQASEGIRLASVAALLGIKAPMVTTEATELIKRGLIRRIPHHTDGRAKLLVITPQGKKLAATIEHDLSQKVVSLLAGLNKGELDAFAKTLETIIANAEQ